MARENAGLPLTDEKFDQLLRARIGGMSVRQAAKILELSSATVRKHAPGRLVRSLQRMGVVLRAS